MKKIIITLFFSIFVIKNLSAQTQIKILRIDDLIKMINMNTDNIEIYASKRDYEIESSKPTDRITIEDLIFKHEELDNYKFRLVRLSSGCNIMTIGFENFKLFNAQKTKVLSLGFKFVKSEIIDSPNSPNIKIKSTTYSKGSLEIEFYNFLDKKFYDGLPYEINLCSNCN